MSLPSSSECFDDNMVAEIVDGLLSDEEMGRVDTHVAGCESCRKLLAALGRSPSNPATAATIPANLDDEPMTLRTGDQVGRFVVLSSIGKGGMGVVFAAYDPKLERKVALKLLRTAADSTSDESVEDAQTRLLREAQAMAQLAHPNIISVFDVGTYKSQVYIAMEFVDGDTLTQWRKKWGTLPWREILAKFMQAGRALADAHAGGWIHRDFKPDNVLVGADDRVRVLDFGLARWLFTEGDANLLGMRAVSLSDGDHTPKAIHHQLTKTGALMGTPRYMAPEQLEGKPADARSDQFSFCVALYEALYDQHPFAENTAIGLLQSPETTKVRPAPPGSQVPGWLHDILVRGLSANPMKRFPSMAAMLREIAAWEYKPRGLPIVAPLALALGSIAFAGIMYWDRGAITEEVQTQATENVELRQQLRRVQEQLDKLTDELNKTKARLGEALIQSESQEEVIGKLRQDLLVTTMKLQDTLGELDALQKATGRLPNVNVPAPPISSTKGGLSPTTILAALEPHRSAIDDCFKEWRDRTAGEDRLFAVEIEITSLGIPLPASRSGGLADRVVHDCVTGAVEDAKFPQTDASTIVYLAFRNGERGIDIRPQIARVVPDTLDNLKPGPITISQ